MIEHDYKFEKVNNLKSASIQEFKQQIYSKDNINKFEKCPYCECRRFIKFGKYQGIQRYRCKNEECKRTFSDTTNSVWKYLKHGPEKWLEFIELMTRGYTLRLCAEMLNISIVTAFYWRHKVLHAIEKLYKPQKFNKIVNIYEYDFEKCYKGSRNKHYTPEQKFNIRVDKLYGRIPCDVKVLIAQEESNFPLINRTDSNSTLTDNFRENVLNIVKRDCYMHKINLYESKSIKLIIEHNKKLPRNIKTKYGFKVFKRFWSYEMKDNIVDQVNGRYISTKFVIHNGFTWIGRFRGIATKYINHYYNLYALIDSETKFDYISIFFKLLRSGSYLSTEKFILSHPEDY